MYNNRNQRMKQSNSMKSRPSYSGNEMPMNINPNGLDEGAEETTRRISFQPSFEPTITFGDPSTSETTFAGTLKPTASIQTSTRTCAAGIWKLHDVPMLPEYHPLEHTAVFVPRANPYDVSMRISNILRERSIEAFYDDGKAKVTCTTLEGVEFRVRLYRGRGRFSHGIIVEVQRRFGTSNVFHDDTMAVLEAAEGKTPCPPPPTSNLPLVSDSDDDFELDGTSPLKMVRKMLDHEGYDSFYLAFQMLQSLTDVAKMGTKTARAVATELLRVDSDVGSRVFTFVLDSKGDEEIYKLRSTAIIILANSIQAVNGNIHEILQEQLAPVLLKELRNAERSPRNAAQAARILQYLPRQEQSLLEFYAALEFAMKIGEARLATLQHQAQRCLEKYV